MRKTLMASAVSLPLFFAGCAGDGPTTEIGLNSPAFKAWATAIQANAVALCGYEPGLSFLLGVFGQGAIGGIADMICGAVNSLPPQMRRRGVTPKQGVVTVRIGGVPFDPARDGRFVR